jgi:hypothetical protein
LPKCNLTNSGLFFLSKVHASVRAFFSIDMVTNVGNGNTSLFWTDNWLEGIPIAGLAPNLFALILKRREPAYCERAPIGSSMGPGY